MSTTQKPFSLKKLLGLRSISSSCRRRKLIVECLEERRLLASIHDYQVFDLNDSSAFSYYQPPTKSLLDTTAFLTSANTGKPLDIALDFLRSQTDKLQLTADDLANPRVTDMYADDDTGVTHIYLMQTLGGVDVTNAVLNVHVSQHGEVIRANSSFINAPPTGILPGHVGTLTPSEALASVAECLQLDSAGIEPMSLPARPDEGHTYFRADGMSLDLIPAKQSYFANQDGQLQPVWEFTFAHP